MRRKRVALFAGQVDETRQRLFIEGFLKGAFSRNMDVVIFSMYRKYQDTEIREQGELNIFNLFNPDKFDGAVILKDSIQTKDSTNIAERRLSEVYKGPVLVIDRESDYFASVYQDDYAGMCEIVEHMITVHNKHDIGYISGKKRHHHSVTRLRAYQDTLRKHGIQVDEDRIFHGDYWYNSGSSAIRFWADSPDGLPEAIVCANDEMAIGVCSELSNIGIKVPEHIAVAGFDSLEEGRLSPLCVTSSRLPYSEIGEYAAGYIYSKLNGEEPGEFDSKPRLMEGETCGCGKADLEEYLPKRTSWETVRMAEYISDINSMMSRNLMAQSDMEGFFGTLYSYAYQIKDVKRFALCLADIWLDMADETAIHHLANEGYPKHMCLAVDYLSNRSDNRFGLDVIFDTAELLPDLFIDDKPSSYIVTPVFCESECFGYAALSYGDLPQSYTEDYRIWIESIAEKLEVLRRTLELEAYKKKLEQFHTNKYTTSTNGYDALSRAEQHDCDITERILNDNLLTYVYQPIVRASDGEIYSYEALMRSATEERINPLDMVKYSSVLGRLQDIEKLTFLNILGKVRNDASFFHGKKIFINSIPGVRVEPDTQKSIEELVRDISNEIVVELTEEAELRDEDLDRTKKFFNDLGMGIAIDDYGAGYSNINNLLRYVPNYVKIDRTLLTDINNKPQKQHFVSEIINFCKDNGILSLAEGIETKEELRTVIHMGVDLIQGYYTGRPQAVPLAKLDKKVLDEITTYSREKEDGDEKEVYVAGNSNRVSLALLVKYGCTDIVVGKEDSVYRDVAISGAPNLKTDINLRVLSGYSGEITLNNVYLSNIKNRPCIDISEGSNVTINLIGNNVFRGAGIRVHKNASLHLIGDGNLTIEVDNPKYYGIGNDFESEHGNMHFDQDGKITVIANGHEGVCIGSGLGGIIRIDRGLYALRSGGTKCCGIGAYSSEHNIDIINCSIDEDINANYGVGIGCLESNVNVYVTKTTLKILGGGNKFVGIGSINGAHAITKIEDASINIDLRSHHSTCLGTLHGRSDIRFEYAGVHMENAGKESLAFGGVEQETHIRIESADTRVELHNNLGFDTYAKDEDINITNGRMRVIVNDHEVKHVLKYD